MNNILIVGGDSTIGKSLCHFFSDQSTPAIRTTRNLTRANQDGLYLDLSMPEWPNFNHYSHAVIAASITSFNACESNPALTRKINIDSTLSLASALLESGCKVIYLSSTAVFDGNTDAPSENVAYSPTTEYGRQKVEVEQRLQELSSNIAIVRLTKVISLDLEIISRIYQNVCSGNECQVFNNLYISPISLKYACSGIHHIILKNQSGVFHLSNNQHLSYSEFAKNLATQLNLSSKCIVETIAPRDLIKSRYNNLGMLRTRQLLELEPEHLNHTISNILPTSSPNTAP